MTSKTRIYLGEAEGKKYLVDTSSVGAARTAIAKRHITVRLARPSEIVQMMKDQSAMVLTPGEDPRQADVEDTSGAPA